MSRKFMQSVKNETRRRLGPAATLFAGIGAACLAPGRKLATIPEKRQPTLADFLSGRGKPDLIL